MGLKCKTNFIIQKIRISEENGNLKVTEKIKFVEYSERKLMNNKYSYNTHLWMNDSPYNIPFQHCVKCDTLHRL
jgi:hypothetical protein